MLTHWIWLATCQGLNDRTKYQLLERCGDPEELYDQVDMAPAEVAQKLKDHDLGVAEKILQQCRNLNIHILTYEDDAYPRRLRGIYDPPLVLYYRGQLPDWEAHPVIGAVGTRRCSEDGIQAAGQLGYQLSKGGAVITSGMAEGIDTAVLCGSLCAEGPVAVWTAGGVDQIYPACNRGLYQSVLRQGCVISECPPGIRAQKWLFPRRNRLISGCSNGVLVVEAPEKSGALITARCAMEQGRDVFAVPGSIRSESGKGSNAILKEGAILAQCGWDVLEYYAPQFPETVTCVQECLTAGQLAKAAQTICGGAPVAERKMPAQQPDDKKVIDKSPVPPYIDVETILAQRTPQERCILQQLVEGPKLTERVLLESGLSQRDALGSMTMLELDGVVHHVSGNMLALTEQP